MAGGWAGAPRRWRSLGLVWATGRDALEDLRWYLEDYLLAPFGVWEEARPAVRGRLAGWGDEVFGSLFGAGEARDVTQAGRGTRAWRWCSGRLILGCSPCRGSLCAIARGRWRWGRAGSRGSLPVAGGAGTLEVAGGRLRVLMVICRQGRDPGRGVPDGGPAAAGARFETRSAARLT